MLSIKAKAVQNLYRRGMINRAGLQKALVDHVITAEEYNIIIGV